jgi:putative transcriptional regulator
MPRRRRFPMRLKELRQERGMTQQALATKVGVSREYIAQLEGGRHDPPLSTLERLARALKVTVGKLVD